MAVGAGYHKVLFAPQEKLFHGLRQAHVAQVSLQHGLYLHIAAAHGIADDDEICLCGDVVHQDFRYRLICPPEGAFQF